jgi:hypothetical protein
MTTEMMRSVERALRKLGFQIRGDGGAYCRARLEIIGPADNTVTCWLGIHCPGGGVIALEVPAEKVLIAANIKVTEDAAAE